MASSVWTSVSQKEKQEGDSWVDNNADLKVSKTDFDVKYGQKLGYA